MPSEVLGGMVGTDPACTLDVIRVCSQSSLSEEDEGILLRWFDAKDSRTHAERLLVRAWARALSESNIAPQKIIRALCRALRMSIQGASDGPSEDARGLVLFLLTCLSKACRSCVSSAGGMAGDQSVAEAVHEYVASSHLSPAGLVAAVQACPVGALEALSAVADSSLKKDCLMEILRHAYALIMEHEPDVVLDGLDLPSVLEAALEARNNESIADCHRLLQGFAVSIEGLSKEESEAMHRVIARLTSNVLSKKHKDDSAMHASMPVQDFEEGELLVSVYKSDADMNRVIKDDIEGILPKKVCSSLGIRGLPVTFPVDAIRDACDKFAAVKSVRLEDEGSFEVKITSMQGAARCFEAISTRGRKFWGAGLGESDSSETPVAEIRSASMGSTALLLEGVESIEQEDKVKAILESKGLVQPISLIPVSVGRKGVILCFESESSAEVAFEALGGVSPPAQVGPGSTRKRSLDVGNGRGDVAKQGEKRAKGSRSVKEYRILRNKNFQGVVLLEALDGCDAPEVEEWPDALDASQRVDVNYMIQKLVPSSSRTRVFALRPITEKDFNGLNNLDSYLRTKGRAGVVLLSRDRTLYLVPTTPEACHRLGVSSPPAEEGYCSLLCLCVDA
jgi:hypothetical protein